jgi:transcriptional antiterminator RfaH
MMALRWYAAQTNPLCERRAEAGLREHGFTVFLPVETKWKRSRSKARERVNTPLFTGYIFVGVGPWQSLYQVRQIDGIRGLVLATDGEPAEISWLPVIDERTGTVVRNPDGTPREFHPVYDLQAREAAGEFDHTPAKRSAFSQGDDARILAGPFKGHVGKMLSADDAGRVSLMLKGIFAGGIIVDDDHLEPVDVRVAA